MKNYERISILAIAALLLLLGCAASAAVHPHVVEDESVCGHCGMLISEARHAAGRILPDGEQVVYDDIACLLAADPAAGATVWFHEFELDGWTPAETAVFVTQEKVRAPMGGRILAFGSADAAEAAAKALDGTVIRSFAELQNGKGGR